MKAIFILRDNPNPPVNGYKKRNYYLLEELKTRNIKTFIFDATVNKNTIQKTVKFITSLFSRVPFAVKVRTDKRIRHKLKRHCKEYPVDLIICDGIHRSSKVPFNMNAIKILYEHNIESEIPGRYAPFERNIFKKIFAYMEYFKFKQLQKKMWPRFDYCIACSDVDKKFIEEVTGKNKVITVNNGVDLEYFSPNSSAVEPDTLVYTGQIGWHPNEDALIYFIKKILPIIVKVTPKLKFWIVGGSPSVRIKSLAKKNKNIIVTGFVDDVRDYMAKAAVYIVPLRIGSGTRLKILEAMSMKKAIVSTSIGCEGIEVEDEKHLLIRDNPEEFAQAVIELLRDKSLRLKLGDAGRKLVEEKYDWKKVFKDLDKILS